MFWIYRCFCVLYCWNGFCTEFINKIKKKGIILIKGDSIFTFKIQKYYYIKRINTIYCTCYCISMTTNDSFVPGIISNILYGHLNFFFNALISINVGTYILPFKCCIKHC